MGLRQRKLLATRLSIETAAVELSAARGIEALTIEEISALAGVSPRTFFNHFFCKEDAVLGAPRQKPSREELDIALAGSTASSILDSIERYTSALFDQSSDVGELQRKRHDLIAENPDLMLRQVMRLIELEGYLVDQIASRLGPPEVGSVSEDQARIIVTLAGGAIRLAMHKWMVGDSSVPLATFMPAAFAELRSTARLAVMPSR